ncbi:MAG: hypothetical protein HYR72_23075 [Deltaproteobacteria bacterium]|nr:hypothetical protein [Deltaproteobacteria bacterium]MBI3390732.1 hypothetical protein [Deltaproteobacteria bacterium]
MLTRADDYLIHQTPEPIAYVGTSDRNFYDRFFFNGYARDGSVYFAAAMGVYPNRQVIDAAFNVVHRGRQYVVRASGRAPADRMQTAVGPIAVEVVEPLRRVRLVVQPNPWEISGDLVFTARAPVLEEPRFFRRINGRVFMDYTRLTQHVSVEGTLTVAGETIRVAPDKFWGSRDRSWGVRPVGERETAAPAAFQFFWLWSPVNFEDLCTHFDVNDEADGARWHQAGMMAPVGGEVETMQSVGYRIEWQSGTRHAKRAEIMLRRRSGEELQINLTPLYNFYMIGLGYQHPQWGHGMWLGEHEVGGESWALKDIDPSVPLYLHIQAVCEATLGKRRGIGILEQLVIGPHAPSGFKELLDLAP